MARRRQVSDEEILEAARSAWLEDPRASTARIAKRIGLSEAAIFKRFRTKVRLMLKAFGVEKGPPWVGLVERGPDDRPLDAQLLELALEVDGFFRNLMPRVAVLKGVGLSPKQIFGDDEEPPPLVGFRALRDWFSRAQTGGLVCSSHDPGALAIAFIGAFQGRAFWRQLFEERVEIADEVYVRSVVSTFSRGLVPEEAA